PPASLPDDDCTLARWARLPSDQWAEVKSEVLAAFKLGADGRHHQKRLRQEYERFASKSQQARQAALKRHGDASAYASALRPHKKRSATRAYGSGSGSGSLGKGVQGEREPDPPGPDDGVVLVIPGGAAYPPDPPERPPDIPAADIGRVLTAAGVE